MSLLAQTLVSFRGLLACTVALILLAVVFPGCSGTKLYKAHRVEKQHLAASAHFAVVSVAPWEEYIDSLQPNFELTEAEAINAVVPTTRQLEASVLDALQVSAGGRALRPQQTRSSEQVTSESTTTEDYEAGTSSQTQTETRVTEDAAQPDPQSMGGGNDLTISQIVVPEEPMFQDQAPGLDPMLLYWAATALYQEVQLLNRYIEDAALRDGYRPYVVRLQISLMPKARNEPYDAYCALSFFASDAGGAAGDRVSIGHGTATKILETSTPRRVTLAGSPAGDNTPQIVPLMVTDNMEATLHSRTVQNIRQLAGVAFFLNGRFGGSTDVNRFVQDIETVLGYDLNSLLTVARVTDNTLLVRLGAMQQGGANYAMTPRNHNVTVLLMVPEGVSPTLQVVAKTTLIDAETGVALPDRSRDEIAAAFRAIGRNYDLDDQDSSFFNTLLSFAQANDQRGFAKTLAARLPAGHQALHYTHNLWLDLVTLMIGSRYSATEFDLPVAAVVPDVEPPAGPEADPGSNPGSDPATDPEG